MRVRNKEKPTLLAEAWLWNKHGDCPHIHPWANKSAWDRVMGSLCKSGGSDICNRPMEDHGAYIDEGCPIGPPHDHLICPGDWLLLRDDGMMFTQNDVLFYRYWEEVPDADSELDRGEL